MNEEKNDLEKKMKMFEQMFEGEKTTEHWASWDIYYNSSIKDIDFAKNDKYQIAAVFWQSSIRHGLFSEPSERHVSATIYYREKGSTNKKIDGKAVAYDWQNKGKKPVLLYSHAKDLAKIVIESIIDDQVYVSLQNEKAASSMQYQFDRKKGIQSRIVYDKVVISGNI